MSIRERLSGNEAAATAMKQINPDVVAAFSFYFSPSSTISIALKGHTLAHTPQPLQ